MRKLLLPLALLVSIQAFGQSNNYSSPETQPNGSTPNSSTLMEPSKNIEQTNNKSNAMNHNGMGISKQIALREDMRKLWEDHITYTRNYIISEIGKLRDVDAVSKRLMKNQDDIGAAVKPYYGEEAGNKLATLLRDHITIATKVVKAAIAGDKKKLAAEQEKWSQNGDEIADFLSQANPNWPKANLQDMMKKHLELTTDEVTSRLKKNWDADVMAYDNGHDHMLMFSDTLTDGIVKQFPDKF